MTDLLLDKFVRTRLAVKRIMLDNLWTGAYNWCGGEGIILMAPGTYFCIASLALRAGKTSTDLVFKRRVSVAHS